MWRLHPVEIAPTTVSPATVLMPESLESLEPPSSSRFAVDICFSPLYMDMDDASPALDYRGGPSTPSASSITTPSNPAVPINELLSPSFLLLFEETLPTSYTIWDHCLEALKGGENPGRCVEDLVIAFEPLLASNVISQICRTLGALEHSILGVETVLIPSVKSVLENVVYDLKERAYSPSPSGHDDGWQPVSRQRPRNGATGRGGSNRSRGSGRGGGSRRSRGGGGRGVGGGSGGSDDHQGIRERNEKAQVFKDLVRVLVNMSVYVTPDRGRDRGRDQEQRFIRRRSIGERAQAFAEHAVVCASHIPYDPHTVSGVACLYHGTRLRMADGFSRVGIQPFKTNTEFSCHPAFYVTNDIASAFEFPLHNRLAQDPQDTVAVFCFEADLQVLHGDLPTPSGKIFDVLWFELSVDDGAWTNFCMYNMYSPSPKNQHKYDIVIGPMCYPNIQERTVIPRERESLQVAFCSEEAWTWIGSCVKRMYIENRVEQEGTSSRTS